MTNELIDIVMPIEEGRFIPHEVIEGISQQGYRIRLWVSTKYSNGDYASARNNIKRYGSSPKVLMLDNDIILPPDSVKRMCQFLDAHPKYAAIAISKHNKPEGNDREVINYDHVDMSCVLFRREVLEQLIFSQGAGTCECLQCCKDIRNMEMEIGFLIGLQVYHVSGTRMPVSH